MADACTLAFTGGGTGGHLYPGLAVVEALRDRGFDGRIVWIGSSRESDRQTIQSAGIEYHSIPAGKLRRSFSLRNATDGFRVLAGFAASLRLLAALRPRLLFSKGGYVSVPPCAAAARLGIPYFTHESDLTPGLATRLNARRAERVVTSYEETKTLLPDSVRPRAVALGNPVRAAIRRGDAARGRMLLGVTDGSPLVLFLGGSQGARQINDLVTAIRIRLAERACIVHQTGENAGAAAAAPGIAPQAVATPVAAETAPQAAVQRYRPIAYLRDELPDILAAADVVVGRAGAGTLWECGALGKAMILVPLAGSGTRGDQVDNAEFFVRAGAASSLVGEDATPDRLLAEILRLLDSSERRAAAGRAAHTLAGRDAAGAVADLILQRIGEDR